MKNTSTDAVYLGLDIGSTSVGWAVCDADYHLSRAKGKDLWGVRLFEEAQTAAKRRIFRIMRRRIARRNERLAWLQLLFRDEIDRVDPGFFQRLQSARLWPEDKGYQSTLFEDQNYHDRDYHRAYPTIYHLRYALLQGQPIQDIRLLYLAVHHILKYRGHFLLADFGDQAVPDVQEAYQSFCDTISDELGLSFSCSDPERLRLLLLDLSMRSSDKQKALCAIVSAEAAQEKEWMKALSGGKAKLAVLFDDPSLSEAEVASVQFSDAMYEEHLPALEGELGDRLFCLEKLRAVYNWAVLQHLLRGCQSLSEAKVQQYQQHQADLQSLKTVVRKYGQPARTNAPLSSHFDMIFRSSSEKGNYASYIGHTRVQGKKISLKLCTQKELCEYLLPFLSGYPQDDPNVAALIVKARNKTLLPKIVSKDNSVIPFQLHRMELSHILNNAATIFPFLTKTDETGLTVCDKLLKLLEFRIPYYVGPLNRASPNSWFERLESGAITPWNFTSKVDIMASAQQFINRMTGQCSYLRGEPVLPHASPLYQRFMALNELNPLTVCGEPISVTLKQQIIQELFGKHKKVTLSMLVKYLNAHGLSIHLDDLGGIDTESKELKSSLKTEISLRAVLGDSYNDELAEAIAAAVTYFGDDRSLLRKYLRTELSLSDPMVARLIGIRATGWGNLSRAFLCDITSSDASSEPCNLITALWQSNETLMELLGERYGFYSAVEQYNIAHGGLPTPDELLAEMYISPSVRRQIQQTLTIVAELRKAIGHDPRKVFVEMPRGGEKEKQRKYSRRQQLLWLYQSCKGETRDWLAELNALKDSDLRRDRLYLYYTQMGKCMYTGESITLDNIFDDQLYDIDHIYPQSQVKDDSLDNRVLVKKVSNAEKSDHYPLHPEIRHEQQAYWRLLLDRKLISHEKYNRLIRSTPFSSNELSGFIARQLVDTRQGTKAVCTLLKRLMPNSEIVYTKANIVSDFRRDYKLWKVREINDLHHAKDAYLSIVVGNVYNTKFTHSPARFIKDIGEKYNLRRMYDWNVARGDIVAWRAGDHGTISTVRTVMARNSVLVTLLPVINTGKLFLVQPLPQKSGQLPLKKDLPIERYGGYSDVRAAHFMLVEHTLKGKRVRSILDVPIHLTQQLSGHPQAQLEYCLQKRELTDPAIIIPIIRTCSLLCIDGFRMYLTGKTGNRLDAEHAHQLILDPAWESYLKRIIKYVADADEYEKLNRGSIHQIHPMDQLTKEKNDELYQLFTHKLRSRPYCLFTLGAQADKLDETHDRFIAMSVESQCRVLRQILKFFVRSEKSANLSALFDGKFKQVGTIRPNGRISDYNKVQLIYQSPTGLYEHTVDLKV